MAERSNDDIANALHGLSSGEHAEQESDVPPSASVPSPTAPPPGVTPRPRPQPKPMAPPRPARPSTPGAAPVQRADISSPQPLPRAGRPVMPAPQHPPTQPAPPEPAEAFPSSSYADGETTNIQPVDEDDAVIVPAAPLSYLGHGAHQPHHTSHTAAASAAKAQRFRQTVTPPLLTVGVLLLATAVLKFLVHPDAVLARLPAWVIGLLVVSGVLILGVGGLNIALARRQSPPPPAA